MLAAVMVLSFASPAFAAKTVPFQDKIPVIRISGDGDAIHDADDKKIFKISELYSPSPDSDSETDLNSVLEAAVNICAPLLIDGFAVGDYSRYYAALEKEISELFADVRLDNNGNVTNGTGIAQYRKDYMENCRHTDKKLQKGYYAHNDYWFWYDWRLDPLENADYFSQYVEDIKKITGAPKVSVISSCLGTSVVMAYVEKYGTDSLYGLGFDGSIVGGSELLSEPISGKFKINGNATNRFIYDCKGLGIFNIDDLVNDTLDLLTKSGALDSVIGVAKEKLYYIILEGVTSALALSTFYTWPSYWSGVAKEDYPTAMKFVFGEEGSKKRTEYAGLIEKIENYNVRVRKNLDNLFDKLENDGVKIGVISKYGFQIAPICESADCIGDQFASVKRSSFGATTSMVYNTLSDSYIAERIRQGKGKYISADKQIDASTCRFPESTWFTKGSSHSNWTLDENRLLYMVVTADRQLTVEDTPYSRFLVYDSDANEMFEMTAENCDTYNWSVTEDEVHIETKKDRLTAFLKSLFAWLASIIRLLFSKLS